MKKITKILSLLSVIILITSLLGCSKNNNEITNDYNSIYKTDTIELNIDKEEFTIFKINDTHLINGTCKKDKKTLEVLKNALDSNEFDLIIVDGDMIEGYNSKITYNKYKAASLFAEVVDSYNIPWTFAPGNNDGQEDGTNEDLIAFLMQYNNFICGNKKGIDGSMQLFIDLVSNGKAVHSIAVMDSNSKDENNKYDYIKQSQIDWLINGINNRKIKTSVFFHMPTPAFKEAYLNGIAYEGYPFSDAYAVDDIKRNKLFDDAISNNEYISLISVAHVHSDNIAYFYNNRYYQLSSLGGYGAVGSKNTEPSFTLITINTNSSDAQTMYSFEQIHG